jgi:hypothetical protein
MCTQSNGLAAGLRGLHGYPVGWFPWSPARHPPAPADPAADRGAAAPRVAGSVARAPAPIDATLHAERTTS